jgi:hypothetical protein
LAIANDYECRSESKLDMAIQLTYCQGGMDEFERTGIYPRKILVHDPVLNKKWQRKITEEKNSGELKIGDKIIYKYHVDIDSDEVNIYHHNGNLINDCLIKIEMRD